MSSDFVTAAKMYEELIKVCPDNDEYKMNYAQALYKAALYPEATRAAVRVDNPQYAQKMLMLQVFLLRHEISEGKRLRAREREME